MWCNDFVIYVNTTKKESLTFVTQETRVNFYPRANDRRQKLKKNEQCFTPRLAAKTSGHVIRSRVYATSVYPLSYSHALGFAKHGTRAEFQILSGVRLSSSSQRLDTTSHWPNACRAIWLSRAKIECSRNQCSAQTMRRIPISSPGELCQHCDFQTRRHQVLRRTDSKKTLAFILEITP